jgi:hypothetical protein
MIFASLEDTAYAEFSLILKRPTAESGTVSTEAVVPFNKRFDAYKVFSVALKGLTTIRSCHFSSVELQIF